MVFSMVGGANFYKFYLDSKMHLVANDYSVLKQMDTQILALCFQGNVYIATPLTYVLF